MFIEFSDDKLIDEFNSVVGQSVYLQDRYNNILIRKGKRIVLTRSEFLLTMIQVQKVAGKTQLWPYMRQLAQSQCDHFDRDLEIMKREIVRYDLF
jgi:hypothetical protein